MQQQPTMADNPIWKAAKPFVNGGLSGMIATCCIQPIDMVKVRLQLGAQGGPVSVEIRSLSDSDVSITMLWPAQAQSPRCMPLVRFSALQQAARE